MTENWETDCSPGNGELVLVELINGRRTLAVQRFGEWNDLFRNVYIGQHNAKRWRYISTECFDIIQAALSTLD